MQTAPDFLLSDGETPAGQNRCQLAPGSRTLGPQPQISAIVREALNEPFDVGPGHSLCCIARYGSAIVIFAQIRAVAYVFSSDIFCIAVKHTRQILPGNGGIGIKFGAAYTSNHTDLCCPDDSVPVPVRRQIRKEIVCRRSR